LGRPLVEEEAQIGSMVGRAYHVVVLLHVGRLFHLPELSKAETRCVWLPEIV
jgi:hypothetical protein